MSHPVSPICQKLTAELEPAAHHVSLSPLQARYDFPSPWWDTISPAAKELVKSLLKLNPEERLSSDQVKEKSHFSHLWRPLPPLIFLHVRVYSSF